MKLSIVIPAFNEAKTIHLILDKVKAVELMNGLKKEVQMALKVLSSFGIKVSENVITYLNSTDEYSNIVTCIEEAKLSGFISKLEEPSSCYAFVHDKVREAAYNLISDDEREE